MLLFVRGGRAYSGWEPVRSLHFRKFRPNQQPCFRARKNRPRPSSNITGRFSPAMAEEPPESSSDAGKGPAALPPPDVANPDRIPLRPATGSRSHVPLKVSVAPGSSADDPELPAGGYQARQVPGADASLGNRLLAAVIDVIVAAGLGWSAQLLGALPFISAGRGLFLVVAAGYIVFRDALPFLKGQSVGKKAMSLQAVTMEGASLEGNWRPGLLRNVAPVVPLFVLVELIVLYTRQDSPKPLLRLGDEWAGTRVINSGLEILGAVGSDGVVEVSEESE